MKTIAVINYGVGNLGSVAKALSAIGARVKVTSSAKELNNADKIVLPGVGAFYDAMRALRKLGIIQALLKNIRDGKPYLGLCLGMQLLFKESPEDGTHKGLGLLPGDCKKFKSSKLKVPHMGWNRIQNRKPKTENRKKECPLLKGIPDGAWMYFVHSYYAAPRDKSCIAATTDYGVKFTSMVWKANIYATQFHPEKSQRLGMRMLENFVRL